MTITNWNSTATCTPTRVVTPKSVEQLVEIVRDTDVESSPSPLRAVGSLHSLNPCFTTTGTLVKMKADAFRHIGPPTNGTVTVGAGVTMFELKEALKAHSLQIAVTPEIGNATAGSVACCGTKDASLESGPGQISSTVVGARIVDASGTERAVTAAELPAFRSSYGLFGIVHEVTFATVPLQRVAYAAELLDVEGLTFDAALDSSHGFLGFLLPYLGDHGQIVVERRTLVPGQVPTLIDDVHRLERTEIWKRAGYPFSLIPRKFDPAFAHGFPRLSFVADRVDTMIDFPPGGRAFFDFAFWAFPLATWDTAIPEYVHFCHAFHGTTGFRPALPTEVYHIKQDQQALLSFSADSDVFTLDMVHMVYADGSHEEDRALWHQMNDDFNQKIALRFGARPLLNQTKRLNGPMVQQALGADWTEFARLRALADGGPTPRFLTPYFAGLGA